MSKPWARPTFRFCTDTDPEIELRIGTIDVQMINLDFLYDIRHLVRVDQGTDSDPLAVAAIE